MSGTDNKKPPSIFQKVLSLGDAFLDSQIRKAKSSMVMNENFDDELFYSKTLTEDPSYSIHATGWKEKPFRLQNGHLKAMSIKDSVISAVIQTRQNHVSNHSNLVKSELERGWIMKLRNEDELLAKIKEDLKNEMHVDKTDVISESKENLEVSSETNEVQEELGKAEVAEPNDEPILEENSAGSDPNKDAKTDDDVEEYNWELERKAREKLESQYKDAKKKATEFILNCGETDNRPFESKKWNFDTALRAWTRDTLTYDLIGTEKVPNKVGKLHYFFPADGGTIKQASNRLSDYKETAENFINLDILYPEKKVEAMEKQKVLELDSKLIDKNAYKWVQVIRGKIERAYTADEMAVGIRNVTTDIYNNGYGISELELVVSLVTGHLNAEYYNQAYFTQGFSAKGILHIKAAINRRKLEGVRQQWQHMLRGSRNSFQTPIFAGVDEVEWIPLTQNHNDIGFEGWMRYLTRMICAIYQIDPHEIGIGFKDEGSGSGGMSGDNTQEKIEQSKDKGLYPLLRFFENYINEQILKFYDDRFIIKFTGITSETKKEALERQEKEVKFKKTVNEIRAEDGLPPLPGMDAILLSSEFMTWYTQFSPEAIKKEQTMMAQQIAAMDNENEMNAMNFDREQEAGALKADQDLNLAKENNKAKASMKKSSKLRQIKVETYKIEE